MSIQAFLFRRGAAKGDKKRNDATQFPAGVVCLENIRYGSEGKDHLLNVYYPEGTTEKLPTIVSIHGGGYVYGDKEVYHFYCADLAHRGFTVVNFNYRLAPKHKFPSPLEDTNRVMRWLVTCARKYHMDPENVIIVGDSAGAQLTSQYAAMLHNLEYMSHFRFSHPGIFLRAIGLNCGMYDMSSQASAKRTGLHRDYLGKQLSANDPRVFALEAIGGNYPPTHITTACHDFLRECAQPMYDFLTEKCIPCRLDCYGSEEDESIGHVFHINIITPTAIECNDTQCNFFRQYL